MASAEYRAAYEAHNRAYHRFERIRQQWRDGEVGDAAFTAAQKEKVEADKVFDAAYAEEEARNPPVPFGEEPGTEGQGSLF